jgi:hypothetical protein
MLVIFDKTPGLSATSNLVYAEKNLSSILQNFSFFLSLLEMENGNFILPLKMEEISDTNAEVVAAAPAPSPCITLCPTGLPSTITAFKTPSIPATYDSFLISVGWTRW